MLIQILYIGLHNGAGNIYTVEKVCDTIDNAHTQLCRFQQ